MEIIAKYSFASNNSSIIEKLGSFGVSIERGQLISQALVPESSELFESIHKQLMELNAGYLPITKFSRGDFEKASVFKASPNWYVGYPQPEDTYREITYEKNSYCSVCFAGALQVAPFQIKTLPKWGKRSMFALNWIHDEIFLRYSVYTQFFAPFGIDCWPVIHGRKPVSDFVQLKLPIIDISFESDSSFHFEICEICHRRKYNPVTKGLFPRFRTDQKLEIFKGNVWFGSGGDARRPIFITKNHFKVLEKNKILGLLFTPVE